MLSNLDTYLEALRTSPLEFLLTLVYAVAVILISLILHECAHGYVAYRCGDPTAKMMGRLSLNPKAHLDLIGTLSILVLQTDKFIYIMEFKLNGTAEEALQQINDKHYALPFETDGRRLFKIGVNFSAETRNIEKWIVE